MATLTLFVTLAAVLVIAMSIWITVHDLRTFNRKDWKALRVFDTLYHPFTVTAYLWLIAWVLA